MNKLHAFGDSFTFGSDLKDCDTSFGNKIHSENTWPSLLANSKSLNYVCHAYPGETNQTMVRRFFGNVHSIDNNDFVVVNWTWINRWDFYNSQSNKWEHLRPDTEDNIFFENYIKYFQSELWDKLETLKAINLVQSFLKNKNIKFIMTCIDKLAFDERWHCPKYIENLQDIVRDDIQWFEGMGFYDWAKTNNYKISDKWHPLEEAHKKAFEYINEFT